MHLLLLEKKIISVLYNNMKKGQINLCSNAGSLVYNTVLQEDVVNISTKKDIIAVLTANIDKKIPIFINNKAFFLFLMALLK